MWLCLLSFTGCGGASQQTQKPQTSPQSGPVTTDPAVPEGLTVVSIDDEGNIDPVSGSATEVSGSDTVQAVTSDTADESDSISKDQAIRDINEKIKLVSFSEGTSDIGVAPANRTLYRVGAGDVLEISVFQVDELNRKVRIGGDGLIMIPLLGGVAVSGMTTTEIEQLLTTRLGEDYLHDPQVSVFVDEYKSQQVAVLGAVKDPSVYDIRQPRSILEMLAMAGGLSQTAGSQIQVRRTVFNEAEQRQEQESLIVELDVLLKGVEEFQDILLAGGDSIVVPEVGSVFVEGSVVKPGAFEMRGETNVLKALSMAGGIKFETSKQGIEVFRETLSGETLVFQVDYDTIRANPAEDIVLQEGDIVVVHSNAIKSGISAIWRGISGIFRVAI